LRALCHPGPTPTPRGCRAGRRPPPPLTRAAVPGHKHRRGRRTSSFRALERGLAGQLGPGRPVAGLRLAAIQRLHPLWLGPGRPAQRLAYPIRSGRLAGHFRRRARSGHSSGPGLRHPGGRARQGAGRPRDVRGGPVTRPAVAPAIRSAVCGARALWISCRPRAPCSGTPLAAADAGPLTVAALTHLVRHCSGAARDGPGIFASPTYLYFAFFPGGPSPYARGAGVDELPARPPRTRPKTKGRWGGSLSVSFSSYVM